MRTAVDKDGARVRHTFVLALDSAATEGEANAVLAGVARIARARRWNLDELLRVLGAPEQEPEPLPFGWHVEMMFGKHKGKTLGEVAEVPGYLRWLIETATGLDPETRTAIESVLEWIEEQGA